MDYKILLCSDWINDNIYAAQSLLKQQFDVDGLQSTQHSCNLSFQVLLCSVRYVQVLHDGNHWITVSNIDCYAEKGVQDRVLILCVPIKIGHNVKMQ